RRPSDGEIATLARRSRSERRRPFPSLPATCRTTPSPGPPVAASPPLPALQLAAAPCSAASCRSTSSVPPAPPLSRPPLHLQAAAHCALLTDVRNRLR
uniref:Uncharacterized protein n=1 Tax=Aegilops tauschii subsp. strangulata TaxID=200361 RepID=A0A452YQ81_AEGTS